MENKENKHENAQEFGAQGLSQAQVQESKNQYGDNSLSEVKVVGFWSKFRDNFNDPMIKILCVALAINVVFMFMGKAHWYETLGIAVAVLLATFVSTFSEYRNENAFQKLQNQASQIKCNIYRDGGIKEVPIDDIVVGDCIMLQTGDKVPADGEIICGSITVDQSVLNGESKEETKKTIPKDYIAKDEKIDFLDPYKVFRGTVVCSGKSIMRVTTVGNKSVYGEIAAGLQEQQDRDSPLKVKLTGLAKSISKFGYIGGVAIAVALLFQRIVIYNSFDITLIIAYCSDIANVLNDVMQAIILAVIIIVMAVPEGLPLMIAIVSALNMSKMLKDNVLVRKIAGIETAGSLNILFSDKTGTITKGKLEVVEFNSGDNSHFKALSDVPKPLRDVLSLSIYKNTDSIVSKDADAQNIEVQKIIGGNATERAVLKYAVDSQAVSQKPDFSAITTVNAIPFNSTNKYSATQVDIAGKTNTLIKGAPEKVALNCDFYYDQNGQKQPFDEIKKGAIETKINELAKRAIRVIALAISEQTLGEASLPDRGWAFVGIVGIRDEVRKESVSAIAEVMEAGVQVVMITGDRMDTAIAIATEAGLVAGKDDITITSDELAKMSDDEVKKIIRRLRVVSRALPKDKSRLVRLCQEEGLVVGMTGDGVNDSLALKKADVGFAMGSGTEVAKEASDIVILDDNFNSIDKAILYGRTIFNSIRKFVVFQLTINVTAVLVSFFSPLLGMENPLTITQILWVNLVMDSLAALAFGGEPALKRFMQEKPKRRDESILSKDMGSAILVSSLWIFGASMFFLLSDFSKGTFRADPNNKYLLTGYFAFFIFSAVFNGFNARTDKINLFDNISKNKSFLRIMLIIIAVQVIMTYVGGAVLRCFGLTSNEWAFVITLAFGVIPVDLIRKMIVGKTKAKK